MSSIELDSQLDDARRRKALFAGALLTYSPRASLKELTSFAGSILNECFAMDDPRKAQEVMSVETFVTHAGKAKSTFTNHPTTKQLIKGILEDFGCPLDRTFFDVPRLRIVTHSNYLSAGVGYAYKPHRDTWYSSPHCQINWWSPLHDLEETRSLAFFPYYWKNPMKNTSADFDYEEWKAVGRELASSQIKEDTRNHPLPTEEIDPALEMRVVLPSSGMVLFSGGHLHGTVPNESKVTRFSIDFRTVHLEDLERGFGSPNVDCASRGTTLADFLRGSDYSPIPTSVLKELAR